MAIVGGGFMGSGIAETAARAGFKVLVCDVDDAAVFDSHVQRLRSLLKAGSDKQLANEAQHGLDVVDQVESVYTR